MLRADLSYCERFVKVVVFGQLYLYIPLGFSSMWLELPLDVCYWLSSQLSGTVLVWSATCWDFFSCPLFLFLIFLSFYPPSLPFSSYFPPFLFLPSVNTRGVLRTFYWLLPSVSSAGHFGPSFSPHNWLLICSDTSGITPLEKNAHLIIFSSQQWVFLCHAKCSTWLKISWFPT